MKISRRTFIAAGVLGAAALATAGWLRGPHAPPTSTPRARLDADAEAVMGAVIPVLLAGALPDDAQARQRMLAETLAGVDVAIAGLAPDAQQELAQLFALLSLPPVRLMLAGVSAPWNEASPQDVRRFLDRCRGSSTKLLRAAYDALHQLTFGAWYGNPASWAAIGYAGPPNLGSA